MLWQRASTSDFGWKQEPAATVGRVSPGGAEGETSESYAGSNPR